jgi:hypothetical protein
MYKRLGWHLLLALVMLLMQQVSLRHALQHAERDDGNQAHTLCVQCLAHHAADASVAPSVATVALARFGHVLTADTAQPQCAQGLACAYLARAPPALFSV